VRSLGFATDARNERGDKENRNRQVSYVQGLHSLLLRSREGLPRDHVNIPRNTANSMARSGGLVLAELTVQRVRLRELRSPWASERPARKRYVD